MRNDLENELVSLHRRSMRNRAQVEMSRECACFHCLERFTAADVKDWADAGTTAICPRCGIDAVLGDACGSALTSELLGLMHRRWFVKGARPPR